MNIFFFFSVYISQFPEYTLTLINHLLEHKINHWDPAVRELTSKALHNLTSRDTKYMAETAIPLLLSHAIGIDLNSRHGAILSLAEIIHALSLEANNSKLIAEVLGLYIFNYIYYYSK